VSETPENTATPRPSLRKEPAKTPAAKPAGKPAKAGPDERPTRLATPRTIDYACIALGVTALALVVRGLSMLGFTNELQQFLINSNNNAKDKKKPNYVRDHLAADLHALRQGTLLMGVVIAIALTLLIFAVRRVRTASGSRWAMLIVMLFTSLPFYIVPISGFPTVPKVAGVLVGAAAIAALLLVFLPKPSQQYFRDCRDAALPPELRGQPRPGLFGPRRQRPGLAGPGGRAAAARATQNTKAASVRTAEAQNHPVGSTKSRAKVRSDADAVARGADLARSRAKASKSRRTTD
jgi:hypothetical protein